jgi:hypothetical protein
MEILNKATNYELYSRWAFGNKLRTWNNVDEFFESKYPGSVSIRYRGQVKAGGMYAGFTAYNVLNAHEQVHKFMAQGANPEFMVLNESAPDDRLLIQGELTLGTFGYNLFYSDIKGKMKDCMKHGIQVDGLPAKMLLQKHLFPNSYDDIMALLELYPGHVIEFSAYEMAVGDCSNRNTIIWEVRKY